ncbi:ATP-binding cassette domain-containing protein [Photorhabdus laumondii subsp. laumondii]|uniref:Cell division ATP-binding protein FtsE n=2 Tax=Photorhabdus laumondii subsp. laumondii TaxID=141679 RepID=Q7MZ22_PHOLL|nr:MULTISPECIES: amino acid ABC transporter ATP-binding protein [Photorhabdus]AWK44017.1 ATP-binding protein [Photorhabdus laumondii subsp. laumondii]AXG44696.1 amino acid ABC transporter ATP-binding protein [Photorhabdus laumondii subsp. laumondii]AXG49332.1 amino acid ABC transporter ATP-binding protein [Photorhabdus laumondii subsp. laumondii]KTL60090.1 ATP-binding protein [Photorhabdus laumondii subsp. laumondii]MCC8386097.1 amino acid ABC transporter ATP-binding protein [Photorhabdus laum
MIQLSGIEKSFDGQKVLKKIELTIEEGSLTALIGPSGSGKSTLLRCINLLEIPQAGKLQIDNENITFTGKGRIAHKDIQRIRQQTGMVFQNFQLFPHLTVIENIMEGLIWVQKWSREQAKQRALELLEKVDMSHKADVFPATLSGGQQQRVAIARALAPSPKVLLCDEPTSALDPELSQEVVAVLKQLAKEGTTMLMATHDLRLAANLAHNVIFLESGEIVESGTSKTIFTGALKQRTVEFVSTLTNTLPDWEI